MTKKDSIHLSSDSESDDFSEQNNKQLSNLDLRDNKLKGNIILGNYINLAAIDLSDNYIDSLDLTAVDNLRTLNCSKNNLTHLLVNGRRLQNLIARNNKLIKISVISVPKKLKFLDVSFNEISQIPDWFYYCKNIRVFEISHNKLSLLPDQFISNEMSNFQKLFLNHNNLISFPPLSLKNVTIEDLRLEQNNLSNLPNNFLRTFANLKSLNVSCNKINELPNCDMKLPMEKLYLTSNFFMDTTMNFIAKYFPKLKHFHASFNSFTFIPNDCHQIWPDLEELNLSANAIFRIPNSIMNLHKLKILRLHSNKLKTIPHLAHVQKLQILDISHNEIDKIDLSKLISKQLQFLDISGNQKLYVDSKQLMNYKSQKTLSLIDVSGCNRSLPTVPKSLKESNLQNTSETINNNWSVGFSETAGSLKNHYLYITQVRNPTFCNTEALFGLFDNENCKDQPYILTRILPRCLLEERAKIVTKHHFLKSTITSIQNELKMQGFHPVQNALIVHYSHKNQKIIMRVAVLGHVQGLLGRKNGSFRLFSSKSNSATDTKTFELVIDNNDEFLLIANRSFWKVFANLHDILSNINLRHEAILIAKKLQDLAQSFGVDSNLSLIFIKLKIGCEYVDHFLNELKQSVKQKSNFDRDDDSFTTDNCCCDTISCNHSLNKDWYQGSKEQRTSPSGQSDQGGINDNSSSSSTIPTKKFIRNSNASSDRKSYRGGVSKLLKMKKDDKDDSDSGMSEEQFKCWEYMLEKNTQLLFDKELNTISAVRPKSSLGFKRRLSQSSPQLSDNNLNPFMSRYFGNYRPNLNPLASKMLLSTRSLNCLNSGPNAAYFSSLQRLMPYNLEYDFCSMKEKSFPNSIDNVHYRRSHKFPSVATTEL